MPLGAWARTNKTIEEKDVVDCKRFCKCRLVGEMGRSEETVAVYFLHKLPDLLQLLLQLKERTLYVALLLATWPVLPDVRILKPFKLDVITHTLQVKTWRQTGDMTTPPQPRRPEGSTEAQLGFCGRMAGSQRCLKQPYLYEVASQSQRLRRVNRGHEGARGQETARTDGPKYSGLG